MKLIKISKENYEKEISFLEGINVEKTIYQDKIVQGCKIFRNAEPKYTIISGTRFKRNIENESIVMIKEGNGHFKFNAIEKDFNLGEAYFCGKGFGELELNGKFIAVILEV